jgi:hypothetical protein
MKRCANCRALLPGRAEHIIIESDLVAGVQPRAWVLVHFCCVACIYQGGAKHGRALATGHVLAYEPDQMAIYSTAEEAGKMAAR